MRRDKPVLSLIMPTFNRQLECELRLKEFFTLNSHLVELVVIIDGSKYRFDHSLLGTLEGESRIIIKNYEENRGRGPCLVDGIGICSGVYVSFWDDDDELYTTGLEELVIILYDFLKKETGFSVIMDSRLSCIEGTKQPRCYENFYQCVMAEQSMSELKQVVPRRYLDEACKLVALDEPRVPTSLFLHFCSLKKLAVIHHPILVGRKIYREDGMSASIAALVRASPENQLRCYIMEMALCRHLDFSLYKIIRLVKLKIFMLLLSFFSGRADGFERE